MKKIINIAAYKFAPLPELRLLRPRLLALCQSWELKGTILLSVEGINLFVAGAARPHFGQNSELMVRSLLGTRAHSAWRRPMLSVSAT